MSSYKWSSRTSTSVQLIDARNGFGEEVRMLANAALRTVDTAFQRFQMEYQVSVRLTNKIERQIT
jgi:hypothetical protein